MPEAPPGRPRRKRPPDRKRQIIRAAGDLFHARGYANVGTGDIAAAVGITAGALYRHFRSKQEILASAIEEVFDGILVLDGETRDLDDLVDHLTRVAAPRRSMGVMWHRESRHLDAEQGERLRQRPLDILEQVAVELMALRPDLEAADAELLSWFVMSTLTSLSYHSAQLESEAEVDLLKRCALAVATTPLERIAPSVGHEVAKGANGIAPRSRHESLIVAASRLFFERGYQAVTMDEIGAAVGITSAGVYTYFGSKSDLLSAVVARASEPLQLGLLRALGAATSIDEALELVLDAYIEFATVHHHLVGILVSEVTNLPAPLRRNVRRQQADYVAEWVRLLRESRPEIDAARARYLVQAVLTVVNDAARTDHLLARLDIDDNLRAACRRLIAVELSSAAHPLTLGTVSDYAGGLERAGDPSGSDG